MNFKKKILPISVTLLTICQSISAYAAGNTNTPADNTKTTSPWGGMLPIIIIYGLLFVVLYFILIRPQKKRQKKEDELRNSVILGDQVITIGGVSGRVVQIKDDEITVESSIDRTLISFKKWAIREVIKLETDDEPAAKDTKAIKDAKSDKK
jgi:preprotein translocase subunit YajC